MRRWLSAAAMGIAFGLAATAPAETIVEIVKTGCEKELTSFCKDVTPGEQRVVACLYAHNDKLSGKCEGAIYEASDRLGEALAALQHMADQCRTDIQTYCAATQPGEGRVINCLRGQSDQLSDGCRTAVTDVATMR